MLGAIQMRRTLILLAAGLVLAGPFFLGYRLSEGSRATTPVAVSSLVDEVRNALAARYYRPVPPAVLKLGSVDEIISALGDPYTAYLAPPDYKLVRQETASSYTGIGLSVLPSPHGFAVVALRPGPAQRAGIRVGDTIVRIGGASTRNQSMAYALSRILGPRGTTVHLELTRGGHRLDLRIRRDVIKTPSVHARLLSYAGRRWGHVRLSSFRVGQHEPHEVFRAVGGVATRLPVVVLVDRYSASSAEIVAAALRDHHRATVVGERTFGKALVQSIDPLDNGAALELTIARYYTPSGADISNVGVAPQIRAHDDRRTPEDEALATALKVLARPAS